MRRCLGDITFLEAYNKTGRILNITVTSGDKNEDSHRVLNHFNSPDILIWSAVVASCALPIGYEGGLLVVKDHTTGSTVSFPDSKQHLDGSVAADLPREKVGEFFNCNYFHSCSG